MEDAHNLQSPKNGTTLTLFYALRKHMRAQTFRARSHAIRLSFRFRLVVYVDHAGGFSDSLVL